MKEFTPIQQSMLKVLSDGRPHTREELHACCGPSSMETIRFHVYQLRKILNQKGESIVCIVNNRKAYYQHVRLLVSPYTAQS